MRAPQDRSRAVEARGRRLGPALGAAAAVLASAALVYWIGAGENRAIPAAGGPSGLDAPRTYAPARPDARQVVHAYDQVREIYADQGASGVAGYSRACAGRLRTDPGVLDFCLAFDIYAAALQSDDDAGRRTWRSQSEARDLALTRSLLPPGQDAAARLAAVRALAREASLEAPSAPGPNAAVAADRPSGPMRTASAPIPPRRPGAAEACRRRGGAAPRVVCASPALREADHRMRLAYDRALAAGRSPRRLAREQARFRTAVRAAAPDRAAILRLYRRRTHALLILARRTQVSAG